MDSPDKSDGAKAAFRKPSNDAASRKYRRRSSTSLSPPPAGSPERRGYISQNVAREDLVRNNDDRGTREKDKRDSDADRYARSGNSYRYDRHSSGRSHGYRRRDDYKDDEDRDNSKFPVRTSHDSRDSRDFGRVRNENEYKRSRDGDKYSRSRYLNDGDSYKSKHTERSRTAWGDSRTGHSSYDDANASRNETDVADCHKSTREDKKKFDYRENRLTKERDNGGSREDHEDDFGSRSRRPGSPLKKPKLSSPAKSYDLNDSELSKETFSKATTLPKNVNDVDNTNNLDAAKVAAQRAAELVNKNLVGVGVVGALSTDQKKKLLWGSKKKAVEESGHIWDASLFPDREQQEKFNRLMGVKGEVKVEQKAGNPEGKSILDAEKQKELQLELEKQYTAGLRRKDGRTVGLGL